jgi:hypothetical protein
MRFAIGVGVAVAAVAVLGNCSINHRSQDFACGQGNTCSGTLAGRVCVGGYCVEPGGIDAAIPDGNGIDSGNGPDAGSGSGSGCPDTCTSCDGTTCTIDCGKTSATSECTKPITCPAGFACNVECNVEGTCRAGINCTNATSCTISCSSANTCHEITCGAGSCDVMCTGSDSCHGVDCNDSCACNVTCPLLDQESCVNVTCSTGQSDDCTLGTGCTSTPQGCDTCM